jgi:pantoate--beta-alanine ligase
MEVIRALPFRPRSLHPGKTIGFVPTMGYLHEGHLSLLRRARAENDVVVLSIFVNPLQFGPNEDFDKYPRDEERDLAMAREAGVDYVFLPDARVMYPRPILTTVKVSGITERMCGASRPGHFEGVATVVLKLFNIVQPDRAYFGLKDLQQVAVVQRMVEDLNVPVDIVPCPTVREADGLALSSRNVYLSAEERRQALVLSESLRLAQGWMMEDDSLTVSELRERIERHLSTAPMAQIDYVEVTVFPELRQLAPDETVGRLRAGSQLVIALAVRFGRTRLIDNALIPKKGE